MLLSFTYLGSIYLVGARTETDMTGLTSTIQRALKAVIRQAVLGNLM